MKGESKMPKQFTINTFDGSIDLRNNGEVMTYKETIDILNEQADKINQLERTNKILRSLYDLEIVSDKYYVDAHWIKNKHSPHPVANVFSNHDANILCGIINNLLPYKLLVRKHKQDIESIYGKSIREQLKEVIKDG